MPACRPTRCAKRHRGQRRSRGGCSTMCCRSGWRSSTPSIACAAAASHCPGQARSSPARPLAPQVNDTMCSCLHEQLVATEEARATLALEEQCVCDHACAAAPPAPSPPAHPSPRLPPRPPESPRPHCTDQVEADGARAARARQAVRVPPRAPPRRPPRARPPETALAHTARLGPPAHVLAYVASGSSWRRIGIVSVFYARSCDTW